MPFDVEAKANVKIIANRSAINTILILNFLTFIARLNLLLGGFIRPLVVESSPFAGMVDTRMLPDFPHR
ncbi:hypothetical protein LZ32DRAFT_372875 [Colletotrichum eremochloae]|nr:hypothetical protein LZ32DRAFT_372875 [Colletotrichum eremochloae]